MIKCIIVEDESRHSNRLTKLLSNLDASIKVCGIARSVEEGIELIDREIPEIVFMDIQLGNDRKAGFALLNKIKEPAFDVIFTTAHIDDNIQEIRRCGLDYVAKPYIEEELSEALSKFWVKKEGHVGQRQLKALLNNLVTENLDDQLIWLYDKNYDIAVKVRDIIYCEAQSSPKEHTKIFYFRDGILCEISSAYGIGKWEETLSKYKFCRIHRQHLANFKHISRFDRVDNMAEMNIIKKNFIVSKSGREKLFTLMGK